MRLWSSNSGSSSTAGANRSRRSAAAAAAWEAGRARREALYALANSRQDGCYSNEAWSAYLAAVREADTDATQAASSSAAMAAPAELDSAVAAALASMSSGAAGMAPAEAVSGAGARPSVVLPWWRSAEPSVPSSAAGPELPQRHGRCAPTSAPNATAPELRWVIDALCTAFPQQLAAPVGCLLPAALQQQCRQHRAAQRRLT